MYLSSHNRSKQCTKNSDELTVKYRICFHVKGFDKPEIEVRDVNPAFMCDNVDAYEQYIA